MAIQAIILASLLCRQAQPKLGFDKGVAWTWLTKQCDMGPRNTGSEAQLKCRDMILAEAKKQCDTAEIQPLTHTWSHTRKTLNLYNVIGYQNWEKASVRVVLMAHYDTRPTADQEEDPAKRAKPILGANDGASGVAVLLELMRHTKSANPQLGICYMFNDGEDLGPDLSEMFLGADYFSKNLPKPKPDYGILLDMIGDKDLRVPVEPQSYAYAKDLTLAVYRHAKTVGLEKTFPIEFGPTIEDDHIPMNKAGIPMLDLIDFDYEPWHTLRDTPDKCSPESLGKVGKLLETWVKQESPWKPRAKK
jgi:glutaminyl-peptide cyclotransferase